MHPVRSIRNFFAALRLAITTFQRLGFALLTATENNTITVKENTASTADLLATVKRIEAAAAGIESSARYLKEAERHSRESAGQRTDFGVPHV